MHILCRPSMLGIQTRFRAFACCTSYHFFAAPKEFYILFSYVSSKLLRKCSVL